MGGLAYWRAIPERMFANLPVAMTTLAYQNFLDPLRWLVGLSVVALLAVCVWGLAAPRRLPILVGVVPMVLAVWQLAYFERVREFIRKPDVIASYMYSNALRTQDYPLYAQDGLLAHAAYTPVREVTDENRLVAGREMFRLACSRCHTTAGVNGVVQKFTAMYGPQPWDAKVVRTYLDGMHNARPFMPPAPGTASEKDALAAFIVSLQQDRQPLAGAQTIGVTGAAIPRDIPLPLPADSVLVQTLLVLLFLWHILFVNLMVGGSLLTLAFELIGRHRAGFDALAKEIAGTITVNKSLAVVFGVGPLLAINLLYTLHFYSANALTGAAWISIVPLVTVAFLVTYLHKYTWDRIAKGWHVALGALGAALFLAIPLIFFANINLMLFPAKWLEVQGFASAFALANAGPRYWHFLMASVAVSSLFLLVYFLRPGYPAEKKADLRRLFYGIALGATCAQLFFGLLVLVTLPKIGLSTALYVVIGLGVVLASVAAVLMGREVARPAERALPRGVAIFALITLTAFAMGYGRHIYRENALREHRRLVAAHTADVGWLAAAAQWREATGQGLDAVPLGRKIFESTCAACHAKDRVLVGPSLQEIASIYAGNPEGIADWSNNPGKKRAGFQQMPAFKLGDEKLKAVAEYVLELGGARRPSRRVVEVRLVRFSADEPHGDLALTGDVRRAGIGLQVSWELRGDLARLSLPAPSATPRRADGLWRDTCFELFLAEPGTTTYREINLAPSGDWNVYRFAAYRQGGFPDPAVTTLPFTVSLGVDRVVLVAELPVSSSPLEIGLTAIVRDQVGALSHWALHHAGGKPDFHLRASFVLCV